jgi:recombinational DNA repair ATPase RecF
MKICKLSMKNHRSLEALDLNFPSYYTAIYWKNDSGQTNVVRALLIFLKQDDPFG